MKSINGFKTIKYLKHNSKESVMMVVEMLYGVIAYGILFYQPTLFPNAGIKEIKKNLQEYYVFALSNPRQWRNWVGESSSDIFLHELLKRAYFKARPVHHTLFALMELLESAQQVYTTKYRYLHLVKTRIIIFSLLALLGRVLFHIILLPSPIPPWLLPWDYALLLSSLAVLCAGIIAMHWFLPNDWLWQGGFTDAAQHWLRYRLLDEDFAADPLGLRLRALERQQMLQGIDLARERQQVLRFYRREQARKIMLQLNNVGEALPLFDLFAVGLPAALVLVVPGLRFFLHL
jgi:hypothetical protein